MINIVSYGDSLTTGIFIKHSTFANAINFIYETNIVSLVTAKIGNGPTNIVVDSFVSEINSIEIVNDGIIINKNNYLFSNIYKYVSSFTKKAFDSENIKNNLFFMKITLPLYAKINSLATLLNTNYNTTILSAFSLQVMQQVNTAIQLLQKKQYKQAAIMLRGLGEGLTPSGDDFLCGYLLALHLNDTLFRTQTNSVKTKLFENSLGNSELVNQFLQHAYHGKFSEAFNNFAHAFCYKNCDDVLHSMHAVLKQGNTSGADMLTGFLIAIQHFL